jgi:hypothetical protein
VKRGFTNGSGIAMSVEPTRVIFERGSKSGPVPGVNYRLGYEHVAEVRKFLRTDLPIDEIALHFGVESQCLRRFIKRRRLCDLKARRDFISLQRSLAREEASQ